MPSMLAPGAYYKWEKSGKGLLDAERAVALETKFR